MEGLARFHGERVKWMACASVLCQCKDKGDLTIWFDLAGVATAE